MDPMVLPTHFIRVWKIDNASRITQSYSLLTQNRVVIRTQPIGVKIRVYLCRLIVTKLLLLTMGGLYHITYGYLLIMIVISMLKFVLASNISSTYTCVQRPKSCSFRGPSRSKLRWNSKFFWYKMVLSTWGIMENVNVSDESLISVYGEITKTPST